MLSHIYIHSYKQAYILTCIYKHIKEFSALAMYSYIADMNFARFGCFKLYKGLNKIADVCMCVGNFG